MVKKIIKSYGMEKSMKQVLILKKKVVSKANLLIAKKKKVLTKQN